LTSQIDLRNKSLIQSELNEIYVGVENEIQIIGIPNDSNLSLKSKYCKIYEYKGKEPFNIIRPEKIGFDTLKLYQNGQLLFEKEFEIKYDNFNVIAQLSNIKDTAASIEDITKNPKINVVIPNCNYDHRMHVIYFELILLNEKGDTLSQSSQLGKNELSIRQIKKIKKLKPENKIIIHDIKVTGNGGSTRTLKDIRLKIIKQHSW
jgi:hypothetical protein